MATFSFTENIIIKDEKLISKLKKELLSTKSSFPELKTENKSENNNAKEIVKKWLNR